MRRRGVMLRDGLLTAVLQVQALGYESEGWQGKGEREKK
jgi:hypothetical protein